MSEPLQIVSLGAGVQSSALVLMAAKGEVTPMPTAAIFADTQAEPASVYEWLSWLEKQLPFPVIRVTKGSLTEVALTLRTKRDGTGTWSKSVIPAFIKNPDGSRGTMQRQCTFDYKVLPLTREAVRLMKEHKASSVIQWIGISLDEVRRMKPSRDKRIENRWPLIEKRLSRTDCLRWMAENGFPKPPRSACIYCPFHSDNDWRRLRDEEPKAFADAVQFDKDYRAIKSKTNNIAGQPFLHSSLKPLDEVDFSTDVERGQGTLWTNECEGMCGV